MVNQANLLGAHILGRAHRPKNANGMEARTVRHGPAPHGIKKIRPRMATQMAQTLTMPTMMSHNEEDVHRPDRPELQ